VSQSSLLFLFLLLVLDSLGLSEPTRFVASLHPGADPASLRSRSKIDHEDEQKEDWDMTPNTYSNGVRWDQSHVLILLLFLDSLALIWYMKRVAGGIE
jgi:hypothetical protein